MNPVNYWSEPFMQYLSVHDFTWINATIVGHSVPFQFDSLEAAMAAQYSYGDSTLVLEQAGNMVSSFVKNPPFQSGNKRTALVALYTYLTVNGYEIALKDEAAAAIVNSAFTGETSVQNAISELVSKGVVSSQPISLRSVVSRILNEHTDIVESLAKGD